MNKIKCLKCNKILESKHRHDFQQCKCENETFVDGGNDYCRLGAVDMNLIAVWNEKTKKWRNHSKLKKEYKSIDNAKYIYIICPVRMQTQKQATIIEEYIVKQKEQGHTVFYPAVDTLQNKEPYEIVDIEISEIKKCNEVHVFWHDDSKGSHFDLGVAIGLGKKIVIARRMDLDSRDSYADVIDKLTQYRLLE